ncbi:MAG: hypothetical protein DRO98_04855, partial [Archaeoglobales archaeon]
MNARADEILRSLPLILIITDSKLRITGCSKEAERLFQKREEKLRGQNITSILLFDGEATKQQVFIAEGMRGDGQKVVLECRCAPIADGFVFACRDVTKEIAEIGELQSYKQFFFRSGDILFRFGRVDINPSFCNILGYTMGDLINAAFQQLIYPEDLQKAIDEISKVLKGESTKFELRLLSKDGCILWFEVVAWPWMEDSVPAGVEGILRDITERKSRELELERRAKKLEVLNRVLRHDLSNYLTALRNYTELVREEAKTEYFERIDDIISRAIELINEIRSAEEVEKAEQLKPVNLSEVLVKEIDGIRGPNVSITAVVPENIIVLANEMLHVVFSNILRNAIIHNDKEEKKIWVTVSKEDGWVEVRIADNGPGIPDEFKEEIFK